MERRLAAIFAADVVGYSSLMERDETGTFKRLTAIRNELAEPIINRHRGRIFKLMGDGVLAEFASVVNAVECAASLQRAMADRNQKVGTNERIDLRIGLNFAEVIIDGDDRYGEGVNMAARLQELAEPGGICVSEKIAREVEKLVAFAIRPLGSRRMKNFAELVPVYRIVWEENAVGRSFQPQLELPNKPSIAVLPFTNMSVDPEQEYFADGLVEDLITGLSKIPSLFVIARNSSFAFKGRPVDMRQISKELGVRYLLEGSVRRAGDRLRITGQLIEGETATHVWADKFEGATEDIFDLQDRLTESIIGALEPTLRRAEIERARRKRPGSLDAYDIFLRALPHVHANTPAENEKALRLLSEALSLDPDYASAHGYAAWSYEQRFLRGGFNVEDRTAALRHANIAMAVGLDDPLPLCIGAFVHATIIHDYDRAVSALERALVLNPNSALAYGFSALVHMFSEDYGRACDHALKALRLSPFDPMNYHSYLALAWVHFFLQKYDDAARFSNLGIQVNPAFSILHATLVASCANLDRAEMTEAASARLLELEPGWTIGAFARMEVVRPERMEQLASALRKAGLPA